MFLLQERVGSYRSCSKSGPARVCIVQYGCVSLIKRLIASLGESRNVLLPGHCTDNFGHFMINRCKLFIAC